VGLRTLLPGIRGEDLRAAVALPPPGPTPLGLLSPWAPRGDLAKVVFSDIFGLEPSQLPLSRADAMAIPAMARARHIICGTIAQQTMRTYRGIGDAAEVIPPAPWINSTGSAMSPWHRLVWTVDDLIFYGWSCWSRTNGADGFPLRMDRLAMGTWSVEPGTGGCWWTGATACTNRPARMRRGGPAWSSSRARMRACWCSPRPR
jgi:hypothetical protein